MFLRPAAFTGFDCEDRAGQGFILQFHAAGGAFFSQAKTPFSGTSHTNHLCQWGRPPMELGCSCRNNFASVFFQTFKSTSWILWTVAGLVRVLFQYGELHHRQVFGGFSPLWYQSPPHRRQWSESPLFDIICLPP